MYLFVMCAFGHNGCNYNQSVKNTGAAFVKGGGGAMKERVL